MSTDHEIPEAIRKRDDELRVLRDQQPRTPPTTGKARDTHGAVEAAAPPPFVARLRELAIRSTVEREGLSLEEATAKIDSPVDLERETNDARERHERAEKLVRLRMDALGLPIDPLELYEDVVARCVPPTDATRAAGAWLRGPRRALAMLGGMGLAKTVSAGLCASQFIRTGRTVAYVEESELVRLYERRTLRHEDELEELLDVDLLIVDELGMSRADPTAVREAVAGTFNTRIRKPGSRMMMLGNLADDIPATTPQKEREAHATKRFATTYGARLVDRIVQMGTVVHLAGQSMRGTPYVSPRARKAA